jgi:hypothetical protein
VQLSNVSCQRPQSQQISPSARVHSAENGVLFRQFHEVIASVTFSYLYAPAMLRHATAETRPDSAVYSRVRFAALASVHARDLNGREFNGNATVSNRPLWFCMSWPLFCSRLTPCAFNRAANDCHQPHPWTESTSIRSRSEGMKADYRYSRH